MDAAQAQGDDAGAAALLKPLSVRYASDPELWQRVARQYADHDRLRYHQALGNAYYLQNKPSAALEQYQLASQAPGDDFMRSSIEASASASCKPSWTKRARKTAANPCRATLARQHATRPCPAEQPRALISAFATHSPCPPDGTRPTGFSATGGGRARVWVRFVAGMVSAPSHALRLNLAKTTL